MVVKTFADIKELAQNFRRLWESWGFEVKVLNEGAQSFEWVIKWRGNFIRPVCGRLHFYDMHGDRREVIWLYSDDKYTGFDTDEVGNSDQNFFRSFTEWIVLAAARIEAMSHLPFCIRQDGKTLCLDVGEKTLFANFRFGKASWVWDISRLDEVTKWRKIKLDSIKRRKEENPVQAFVSIAQGIALSSI